MRSGDENGEIPPVGSMGMMSGNEAERLLLAVDWFCTYRHSKLPRYYLFALF